MDAEFSSKPKVDLLPMSHFTIRNGEDITASGFPFFVRKLWFNIERRLYDELLTALLQDHWSGTDHSKWRYHAMFFERALKTFVRKLAMKYNLHPMVDVRIDVPAENWNILITWLEEDWRMLTSEPQELRSEVNYKMRNMNLVTSLTHRTFINDKDPSKSHLLDYHAKKSMEKAKNFLNYLQKKRVDAELAKEQFSKELEDFRYKLTLLHRQRLMNIVKR